MNATNEKSRKDHNTPTIVIDSVLQSLVEGEALSLSLFFCILSEQTPP